MNLTPAERSALRSQAHGLSPVVMIGESGLTPAVVKEADTALKAHGLKKYCVSFMSRSIATTTKSLSWMCEAQSSPNTLPIACLLRESVS